MKTILLFTIRIYQATLSPDHGFLAQRYPYGFCRHYPSCSQYAHDAVERFGPLKGAWLAGKRVLRCAPWSESRIDLVPDNNKATAA
jgi:putative membrane protein insertion efficiency factor